jgi:DNA-binding transcriptional regulator YhcF (GntR family)
MFKIFNRKSKSENVKGLCSAKTVREEVIKYSILEEERIKTRTRNYLEEKVAPSIRSYARLGLSNLTLEYVPNNLNRNLLISILKGKGYTVDEFGEKIEIYW